MERYHWLPQENPACSLDILEMAPQGYPTGVVVLVHDMHEHKERYRPLMEQLLQIGCACLIADHRGHGSYLRQPDDFAQDPQPDDGADLEVLMEMARQKWPDHPVFLFAHGLGTLCAWVYMRKADDRLCGVIFSAPMIPHDTHMSPSALRSLFAHAGPRPGRICPIPDCKPEKGQSVERFFYWDDRAARKEEAGWQTLLMELTRPEGWQVARPDLPVLLAAGQDDPMIAQGRQLDLAQSFLGERGYSNVKRKLYPDMRHEILHEVNRAQVMTDFVQFIDLVNHFN